MEKLKEGDFLNDEETPERNNLYFAESASSLGCKCVHAHCVNHMYYSVYPVFSGMYGTLVRCWLGLMSCQIAILYILYIIWIA